MSGIKYTDDSNGVKYDPETDTYYTRWDTDDPDSLVPIIINAVTAVTKTDTESLKPLHNFIEPDSLLELFKPVTNRDDYKGYILVEFDFGGCNIRIRSDDVIILRPLDKGNTGRTGNATE